MKKNDELFVLKCFLDCYDETIQILSLQEAQIIFPNYTGENPDFIIKANSEYIGVELFELTPDFYSTGKKNIQNNAHFSKVYTKDLIPIPYITEVASSQINKKIKKLDNYVTSNNWLLGYGLAEYNSCMLKDCLDDKEKDNCMNYIRNNIYMDNRVKKIFLYERRSYNIIIDLLDKDFKTIIT